MTDNGQYNVNFFKAKTPHAKASRTLILSLAIIWAIGVFGFQFLLIAFNEETPEKAYTSFESLWPSVVAETSLADQQEFSKSLLHVIGKNATVKPSHQTVVKEMFSWNLYQMVPDSLKLLLTEEPTAATFSLAKETLGLTDQGMDQVLVNLLPYSIIKVTSDELSESNIKALPDIMKLYLVHNRSFLTDTKFIGFPFHYWYTAQFLLILFVVLCVIYAVMIGRINKNNNFVEKV